jgi:oxalate decarboxylase/phosphoglucose isomerase-like protein (cupin superfamily)
MGKLEGVNVADNRNEDAQGTGVLDESFEQNIVKPPEEDMTYFQANFDRSTGKRMGLAVRQDLNVKLLQIMCVESGESAASDWNAQHPKEAVQQGDYIISVNSQSEMASIVVECKKTHMLRVVLKRPRK